MLSFLKRLRRDNENNDINGAPIRVSPVRCLRLSKKDVLCHNCVKDCPVEAIDLRKSVKLISGKCNGCGNCIEVCPAGVFSFPQEKEDSNISRREFFQRFRMDKDAGMT